MSFDWGKKILNEVKYGSIFFTLV